MRGLPNYATVRIVQLRPEIDHTPISSSFDSPSSPEVGDIATIVDRAAEGTGYLVEKVQGDGRTEWLALFAEDELQLLSDAV